MKSIVFVCPYFGHLPREQFPLWLLSCSKNPTIDWLLITDDRTNYQYPSNVKVRYLTFDEMKSQFQEKFSFPIALNNPYKLCDFKSAYGYLFNDIINEYDYWGHCDISDCIFGNLRHFLSNELLEKNDKIGFLGHMTLYRNKECVNMRIFQNAQDTIGLKEVLENNQNMAYDESMDYGINAIYNKYNYPQTRIDFMYSDISAMNYAFHLSEYDNDYHQFDLPNESTVFEWDNGRLYKISVKDKIIKKSEIGYVHFQKRKMKNMVKYELTHYYIIPNKFIPFEHDLSVDEILFVSKDRFYMKYWSLKWKALKHKINMLYH